MTGHAVVNDTQMRDPALDAPDAPSARATVYAILSACFTPPTAGLLEDAGNGALAAALAAALPELSTEQEAWEPALQAFEALEEQLAPGGPCETLRALQVEHTRLFLGPGLPVVPPYESVYADQEDGKTPGPLWGPAAFSVRAAYQKAGLAPRAGDEPPDQLAAELEFMAFLSQREATAAAAGDAEESERAHRYRISFLAEHLSRWAPLVGETLAKEARHPLYGAAGRLLRAVLAAEG